MAGGEAGGGEGEASEYKHDKGCTGQRDEGRGKKKQEGARQVEHGGDVLESVCLCACGGEEARGGGRRGGGAKSPILDKSLGPQGASPPLPPSFPPSPPPPLPRPATHMLEPLALPSSPSHMPPPPLPPLTFCSLKSSPTLPAPPLTCLLSPPPHLPAPLLTCHLGDSADIQVRLLDCCQQHAAIQVVAAAGGIAARCHVLRKVLSVAGPTRHQAACSGQKKAEVACRGGGGRGGAGAD